MASPWYQICFVRGRRAPMTGKFRRPNFCLTPGIQTCDRRGMASHPRRGMIPSARNTRLRSILRFSKCSITPMISSKGEERRSPHGKSARSREKIWHTPPVRGDQGRPIRFGDAKRYCAPFRFLLHQQSSQALFQLPALSANWALFERRC